VEDSITVDLNHQLSGHPGVTFDIEVLAIDPAAGGDACKYC
jgi:FKBP-type peptidyl-prolyl cis-trans isomerase 2